MPSAYNHELVIPDATEEVKLGVAYSKWNITFKRIAYKTVREHRQVLKSIRVNFARVLSSIDMFLRNLSEEKTIMLQNLPFKAAQWLKYFNLFDVKGNPR